MNLRQIFIAKWNLSEFGVKTRVCKEHSQQLIHYILKTPKYSNYEKLQNLIQSIEFNSKKVLKQVQLMNDNIQKIN